MIFEIKNKVALVTGGASGIGLEHVKELLKQGAKGVTIADINLENGEKVIKELNNEFGINKVIFVLTDISNSTSFDNAFQVTIDKFKNIDILINNAAICRDNIWEKEIDINLKGTVNGIILGLEKYLKQFKQGDEGVILNTSSISALTSYPTLPVYSATKVAILTLTKCWGQDFHFERTKVRVLAICPGVTDTPILANVDAVIKPEYVQNTKELITSMVAVMQSPTFIATESVKLLQKALNGSIWVIEESKPAYQFIAPDRTSFEKNILK